MRSYDDAWDRDATAIENCTAAEIKKKKKEQIAQLRAAIKGYEGMIKDCKDELEEWETL